MIRSRKALAGRLATMLLCATAATGCVYKINIQQGNFLDDKTIAKVEPGMTRSQVRYLLGTPMIADSFHAARWDYVFYFRHGKTGNERRRHLIVHFDGDTVSLLEEPPTG